MGNSGSVDFSVTLRDFKPFPIVITKTGRTVTVNMPIPSDYKNTELVQMINERRDEEYPSFVHIMISIKREDNILFINAFYVYAVMYKHAATQKEQRLFKGVGKKTLCSTIEALLQYRVTVADRIRLEASGGSCTFYTEAEKRRVLAGVDLAAFKRQFRESAVSGMKKRLREVEADEERDERDVKRYRRNIEMIETDPSYDDEDVICGIVENRKLIQYYQKALGFHIIEDRFDHALMEASVASFTQACKTVVKP